MRFITDPSWAYMIKKQHEVEPIETVLDDTRNMPLIPIITRVKRDLPETGPEFSLNAIAPRLMKNKPVNDGVPGRWLGNSFSPETSLDEAPHRFVFDREIEVRIMRLKPSKASLSYE